MAFEMASTNLVLELSIILIVLMGWQFMLAEVVGAFIMVAILVFLFRVFLRPELVQEAREQADRGIAGRMEGQAEMDMSVSNHRSIWRRITSPEGFTAISHYFVMDWAAVWMDIVGGLLIAGALAAWVPNEFWQSFFLVDLGAIDRTARRRHLVRMFGWQYPARRSPLERRHQFRWSRRIHLRRPHRAADPGHLPQILWMEDDGISLHHVLCSDDGCCPDRGGDFSELPV